MGGEGCVPGRGERWTSGYWTYSVTAAVNGCIQYEEIDQATLLYVYFYYKDFFKKKEGSDIL